MQKPWTAILLFTTAMLCVDAYVKTFYNCAEPGTLSFIFTGPLNTAAMPRILDTLKARGLYGTFFSTWTTPDSQTKALAQQLLDAGHGLGIQLYLGNDNQTDLSGILTNLKNQAGVLQSVVGTFPRFYYPTVPLQVPLRNYVNTYSNFTEINPTIPHEDLGVCADAAALNRTATERIHAYLGPLWLTHFPNSTYIVGASTSCEPGVYIDYLNSIAPNHFVKLPQCVQYTYAFLTTPEYYGSGSPPVSVLPVSTATAPTAVPNLVTVVDDVSPDFISAEPVDVYLENEPIVDEVLLPTVATEFAQAEVVDATAVPEDFLNDAVDPFDDTHADLVHDTVDPMDLTAIPDSVVGEAIDTLDATPAAYVDDIVEPIDDAPADFVDSTDEPIDGAPDDFIDDTASPIDATVVSDDVFNDTVEPTDADPADFVDETAEPIDATAIPEDFINDAIEPPVGGAEPIDGAPEDFIDDTAGPIDSTTTEFIDESAEHIDAEPIDATAIPEDFINDAIEPPVGGAEPIDGAPEDFLDDVYDPADSGTGAGSSGKPVNTGPEDSVFDLDDSVIDNLGAVPITDEAGSRQSTSADSGVAPSTCRAETVTVTIPAKTISTTVTVTVMARQSAVWTAPTTSTASANQASQAREAAAQSSSPSTCGGKAMAIVAVCMMVLIIV